MCTYKANDPKTRCFIHVPEVPKGSSLSSCVLLCSLTEPVGGLGVGVGLKPSVAPADRRRQCQGGTQN